MVNFFYSGEHSIRCISNDIIAKFCLWRTTCYRLSRAQRPSLDIATYLGGMCADSGRSIRSILPLFLLSLKMYIERVSNKLDAHA